MKKPHVAAVLLAGTFWGVVGLFNGRLNAIGVDSGGISLIRSGGCMILFGLALLLKNPRGFKIRLKDLLLFILFGMGATFLFTYWYYRSIELAGLGVSCTLMYSAPIFVTLLSIVFFKEKFTKRKLLALVLSFSGVVLVSGIIHGVGSVSLSGIVFGLLAGIGYAFYSILLKLLSQRGYSSLQINFYGWIFCFLAGLLLWGPSHIAPVFSDSAAIAPALGLIVISGFLPALLYSWGLGFLEAGKAAMMASVEPVVSTLSGIIVYQESISLWSALGIALVVSAVIVLNLPEKI